MTEASGKSRQFCSVCKDWLDMEVVSTGDGDDDDGVVWYRCPQCLGFLPKLKGPDEEVPEPEAAGPMETDLPEEGRSDNDLSDNDLSDNDLSDNDLPDNDLPDNDLPWDSPAAMMAQMKGVASDEDDAAATLEGASKSTAADAADAPAEEPAEEPVEESEEGAADAAAADQEDGDPLLEYAAQLAAADVAGAVPYRPWETYELGQCVNHLAWEECGVVVAKEELPGGRKAIKCYFEDAGVIRLIEQASR